MSTTEAKEYKDITEYGYIKDGKVYLKGYYDFKDREIGVVRESDEASLQYFINRFDMVSQKLMEVKNSVETSENKGSYLMKLIHMRTYLAQYNGLGDFKSLFELINQLEDDINVYVQHNREKNYNIKKALLKEAEDNMGASDWKPASALYRELKMNWIKTGSAHKEYEDLLNQRFNMALETFYKRRAVFYQEQALQIKDRMNNYSFLLNQLRRINKLGGGYEFMNEFKGIQQDWRNVGKVPKAKFNKMAMDFKRECGRFMTLTRGAGYGGSQGGGYGANRGGGYGGNQGGGYGGNQGGGYGANRGGGYGNREGGSSYGNREGGYGNREGGYGNREGGSSYGNREGGYGNRNYGERKPYNRDEQPNNDEQFDPQFTPQNPEQETQQPAVPQQDQYQDQNQDQDQQQDMDASSDAPRFPSRQGFNPEQSGGYEPRGGYAPRQRRSPLEIKRELLDSAEQFLNDGAPYNVTGIKNLQNAWKELGKHPSQEDKEYNLQFRIICNEIFESHFLDRTARNLHPDFGRKTPFEQLKAKLDLLRDSIYQDEQELHDFNYKYGKALASSNSQNVNTEEYALHQERNNYINKIKTKQRILKKLEDQLLAL